MACFVCPMKKERMCDGPCGLGCVDCPGGDYDAPVSSGRPVDPVRTEEMAA